MRAIIAPTPGGPEVLQWTETEAPTAQPGEVEIDVEAFGLNKAESYYRSGNYGTLVPDRSLGIEAVGVVHRDPSGALAPGQRVVTAMGGMMFARHGSYAERIAVRRSNLVPIDVDLDSARLAALPMAYLTVWGALDKNLGIQAGQSLLVRGATSSVGMAAVAYAKARGLRVLATTRNPDRREKLESIGADQVLIDTGELCEQVRSAVPGGVDGVLEIVGASTVRDSLKSTCPWGQVVVIGLLGGPPVLDSFNLMGDLPNTVRLSFFGSALLGSEAMPLDASPLKWVAQQVAAGAIPDTLAQSFSVEQIQDAHRLLDRNTATGKIVVQF